MPQSDFFKKSLASFLSKFHNLASTTSCVQMSLERTLYKSSVYYQIIHYNTELHNDCDLNKVSNLCKFLLLSYKSTPHLRGRVLGACVRLCMRIDFDMSKKGFEDHM